MGMATHASTGFLGHEGITLLGHSRPTVQEVGTHTGHLGLGRGYRSKNFRKSDHNAKDPGVTPKAMMGERH